MTAIFLLSLPSLLLGVIKSSADKEEDLEQETRTAEKLQVLDCVPMHGQVNVTSFSF
jgi:hypothetical protein